MTTLSKKIEIAKRRGARLCARIVTFKLIDAMFLLLIAIKEKREGVFYTVHKRPKESKNILPSIVKYNNMPKTAIVMQGQVITKNNFTLETALLYRKFFPDTALILSTWKNEDQETIKKIRESGWSVIENEKPLYSGHFNINYQIVSSVNGIKLAKELGLDYVLKTRTDQRMNNPNSLQIFHYLDSLYPPHNNKQTRRLFVPNIGTLQYRPYGVGDMIMFGHINDMILYWDAKHDMRADTLEMFPTVIEIAKIRKTEVYLCTEYLEKIKQPISWTLNDSWTIFGKYFCIFDNTLLDMFWYKYQVHEEYRFHYYNKIHTHQLMHYYEWVACYKNLYNPMSLPEEILNTQIGEALPNK